MTADCLACSAGMSVDDYCLAHPATQGCETDDVEVVTDDVEVADDVEVVDDVEVTNDEEVTNDDEVTDVEVPIVTDVEVPIVTDATCEDVDWDFTVPDGTVAPNEDNTHQYRCMFEIAHNDLRELHGSPPMEWSDELADIAQKYVNTLGSTMVHDQEYYEEWGYLGENLYWISGAPTDPTHVVSAWYDEIADCDTLPGCRNSLNSNPVGHFTALVWMGNRYVGCATNEHQVTACKYAHNQLEFEDDYCVATNILNPGCYEAMVPDLL